MDIAQDSLVKNFGSSNLNKVFIGILVVSVVLGIATGFLFTQSGKTPLASAGIATDKAPATAQQDSKTFKDFAEGTIQKRPAPKNGEDYIEGTHLLIRDTGISVALTSSVVDLSQYEGKKVKVFGETQKAIKEGWLMDVGKVEVQ